MPLATIDVALSLPIPNGFASPLAALLVAERGEPSSDATAPMEETTDQSTLATEPLESCMARWDAETHMTKNAWKETCERIARERLPYVKGKSGGAPDSGGSAR